MSGPGHLIRKPLPAFSNVAVMPDQEFKTLTNKDFEGNWTVIFTYPLDFTCECFSGDLCFAFRRLAFALARLLHRAADCSARFLALFLLLRVSCSRVPHRDHRVL